MSISTNATPIVTSIGARGRSVAFIALDNSYPTGGYTIDPATFGLTSVETMLAVGNLGGFTFSYDTVNGKFQVFDVAGGGLSISGTAAGQALTMDPYTPTGTNAASALSGGSAAGQSFTGNALGTHSHDLQQVNEAISVTAGTGVSSAASTLPIANVESVYVTAGGVTGPFKLVPAGVVPASGEVGYNPTTGVFQFLIADAITAATIQYLTRAVTAVSAGTPSGSNAASAVSGTADAQVFTGDAATLTGTNAASAISATVSGAIAMGEVPGSTDLSAITNLEVVLVGQYG